AALASLRQESERRAARQQLSCHRNRIVQGARHHGRASAPRCKHSHRAAEARDDRRCRDRWGQALSSRQRRSTNSGTHLLPTPFSASLETAYLPTRIEQHDYPNLIQPGGKVPTVATGTVIARRKGRSSLGGAVAHFVEVLLPRFAELQTSDRHPKWREV